MFRFETLDVYKRSVAFSNWIYGLTRRWPREHLYGLSDQLRRASLSIALNITEGCSRSDKDFQRFLRIARGSCYECIPLIEIAFQQGLISGEERSKARAELTRMAKMISSLMNSMG